MCTNDDENHIHGRNINKNLITWHFVSVCFSLHSSSSTSRTIFCWIASLYLHLLLFLLFCISFLVFFSALFFNGYSTGFCDYSFSFFKFFLPIFIISFFFLLLIFFFYLFYTICSVHNICSAQHGQYVSPTTRDVRIEKKKKTNRQARYRYGLI